MVPNEESTGIREGHPPPSGEVAETKRPRKKLDPWRRARLMIFAYSSCAIPPLIFFLSVYVLRSAHPVLVKQCLLLLFTLPCGIAGVLGIVSLAGMKGTDDFVSIFPGAFFGVLGAGTVGFFVLTGFGIADWH